MEPDPVPESGAAPDERVIQTSIALVGDGTDIAQARHLAVGFLTRVQADHGLPVSRRAVDLTQLVVSELVTNARKYAPGPVLLDLRITGDTVEVIVWDSDPVLPIARAADAGRVGQHGLEIVMAVAQGFEAQREPVGKRITARLGPGRRPQRHHLRTPALVKRPNVRASARVAGTGVPGQGSLRFSQENTRQRRALRVFEDLLRGHGQLHVGALGDLTPAPLASAVVGPGFGCPGRGTVVPR